VYFRLSLIEGSLQTESIINFVLSSIYFRKVR